MKTSPLASQPCLHFKIGSMHIAVRSILPGPAEDMAHLYESFRERNFDADPIRQPQATQTILIEAVRGRSRVPLRKRYEVWGNGKSLFRGLNANEVLPYMEWAVNWQIMEHNRSFLQIHAATLSYGESGLILAGGSGSGKSTLACGLTAKGWRYLCDEFALIHPKTLRLHAFPKAVCVKEGSFGVVEAMGLDLWKRQHYAKAFKGRVAYLKPNRVSRLAMNQTCPVRCVIFPRYVAARTPKLTPMPRAEAALELARTSFNRQYYGPHAVQMLTEICRHAQCYRLESGDLNTTCELIEAHMSATAAPDGSSASWSSTAA